MLAIQKETSSSIYTPFKSDVINNIDHMRIMGTHPSWEILSQTKKNKKLKSDAQKCKHKVQPQSKARRNGVINPKKIQFQWIKNGKFDALKTLRVNRSRP